MDNLRVNSILENISNNLELILEKISYKQIAIYEMDEISYAIQSLLKNRGLTTDYYVMLDDFRVIEEQRRLSGISIRYSKDDTLVSVKNVRELDKENDILLIANKNVKNILSILDDYGWKKDVNYFLLYNWENDEFKSFVRGKNKISDKELQYVEKDILKAFDSYCNKSNLRYWVCGGTLLGTIRHKGFIPWDDDIDVYMPWEDYKKFIHSYNDNEVYRVASMGKEFYFDKCKCYWSKMIENKTISKEDSGLMQVIHPAWIDIFPIIGLPEDEFERRNYFKQAVELNRRFTQEYYRNNGNMEKRNKVYYDFVKLFEGYSFDESKYVGIIGTQYGEKDCTSREIYDDTIRMPFEDIEVNVPSGYKEYLDNLYGKDWMDIPPEEKRIRHNIDAYWL